MSYGIKNCAAVHIKLCTAAQKKTVCTKRSKSPPALVTPAQPDAAYFGTLIFIFYAPKTGFSVLVKQDYQHLFSLFDFVYTLGYAMAHIWVCVFILDSARARTGYVPELNAVPRALFDRRRAQTLRHYILLGLDSVGP